MIKLFEHIPNLAPWRVTTGHKAHSGYVENCPGVYMYTQELSLLRSLLEAEQSKQNQGCLWLCTLTRPEASRSAACWSDPLLGAGVEGPSTKLVPFLSEAHALCTGQERRGPS